MNLPSANDSRPEATRSTRAAERLVLAGAAIAIAGSAWLVDPFAEAAFDAPKRAAVLGGAALGALGLARDDAAPQVGGLVGLVVGDARDRLRDHLDVGGREDVTQDGGGPAPADESTALDGQIGGGHRRTA